MEPLTSSEGMDQSVSSPAQNPLHDLRSGIRDPELYSWWCLAYRFKHPEAAFTSKLGKPDSVEHDGRIWSTWRDNDYVVYICGKVVEVDLPEGVDPETCARSLLWDMDALERVLTRQEYQEWYDKGWEIGDNAALDFENMELPDLKKFVLAYSDGQVFCDHHVRNPDILPVVFMPLVCNPFGPKEPEDGEEPSKGWLALESLPEAGEEPKPPEKPEKPKKPRIPPKGVPPIPRTYDPAHEARLLERASDEARQAARSQPIESFDDLLDDPAGSLDVSKLPEVQEYRAHVDSQNESHVHSYRGLQARRRTLGALWRLSYRQWKVEVQQWEDEMKGFAARHQAWCRAAEIASAAREGFFKAYLKNLGCIYEYYHKAGPRSVNGCPTFFSFHVVSKSDWLRARKAIRNELERRENLEI